MRQIPCLLVLGLALAACRSTAPSGAAVSDGEPLASAASSCGRYTLRLERSEWRTEIGQRPKLSMQLAFRTDETDALLCGQARVTDLVPPDGTEFREGDLKGLSHADSGSGTLSVHDVEVYGRTDRLQRLRIECRVMRVLSWRTYRLTCAGPGDEEEFVCPPYRVGVSGENETCHVGASFGEDWRTFPPAQRDLFGLLGHDWVAGSVVLLDASGKRLEGYGASGGGGFTVAHFGSTLVAEPGSSAPRPIAYPVTGTLRLPERYVVEVVPFEFLDFPPTRGMDAPAAATDPTAEDQERLLFALSDEQLFARGITSVDQPGWKAWAVAWTEDRGPKFEAVDRVLREAGCAGLATCDLGMCGWYVKREEFFRARRALVADAEVKRLGVFVVTPRVGEDPRRRPWAERFWEQ
jgi:hypothetical protein